MRAFTSALIALLALSGMPVSIAQVSLPKVQASLSAALLCEGDPVSAIRALAREGSYGYADGFAGLRFGEDLEERNVVILRNPLRLAGGQTSGVVLSFGSGYADFQGVVYAEFEGDYRLAVRQLALASAPLGAEPSPIGKFQRVVGKAQGAKDGVICPKTIALTPLPEAGKFLLGCGWCNG